VPTITEPGLCVDRDSLQNAEALKLSKVKRCAKLRPSLDHFQRVLHAELGGAGLGFSVAMVGQHAGIVPLKGVAKSERRQGGKYLDTKGRIGIYDGTKLKCEHRRERSTCKDCGGSSICQHGRKRSRCKDCGGASICEHGRQRPQCKECSGSGICEHGRRRSDCKECGGVSICEHSRQRSTCNECRACKVLQSLKNMQ